MKEFVNKLIGRLEEKENEAVLKAPNTSEIANVEYQKWMMKSYGFKESIKIVNELTEEYKYKLDDEWQIIYNKILNLEKKYTNERNIESVKDCIRLENLLQYFKEELQSEEEYKGGWISVDDRLPEETGDYLVTQYTEKSIFDYCDAYRVSTIFFDDKNGWWDDIDNSCGWNIIAWMPLPSPYKEGCE